MLGKDSIDDMIQYRNKLLVKLFTVNGLDVRLAGTDRKPYIIYNEELILSCHVKNFDLHFVSEPTSVKIVKRFTLMEQNLVSGHELREAIELCVHRPVYKIKLDGPDNLFIIGYEYPSNEIGATKYPVFGKYKPFIFFNKEYALGITESLINEGYPVVIV